VPVMPSTSLLGCPEQLPGFDGARIGIKRHGTRWRLQSYRSSRANSRLLSAACHSWIAPQPSRRSLPSAPRSSGDFMRQHTK
jgi:hypothetical protein